MKLYAFTCGSVTAPFRGEADGEIRVPVPSYLIEHEQGRVLVDTGMHPGVRDDPHARIGWVADMMKLALPEDEDIASRLRAIGVEPGSLRYLVNTHLHFDHAGGNELIPEDVELVVQRREWQAGHDEREVKANVYNPSDYDQSRKVLAVEGEHDLFGDGTILLLPTPGHTPGHQSLRLNLDGADVVICADACYFANWMDSEETPPYGFDKDQEVASLRGLRALRDAGAWMIYGHDPGQWASLPLAPDPVAVPAAA
jgi:glyoxylase-like metal-dependent hydrolase (beta-lactamase superfamily II)